MHGQILSVPERPKFRCFHCTTVDEVQWGGGVSHSLDQLGGSLDLVVFNNSLRYIDVAVYV